MDIFIMTPKISFQNNVSGISSYTLSASDTLSFINSITNDNYMLSNGNNISDELVYRRKFHIPRRTVSVSITPTFMDRNSSTNQFLYNKYAVLLDSSERNNFTTSKFPTHGISANLAYTEPAWKNGMVQIAYNFAYTFSQADTRLDTIANGKIIFINICAAYTIAHILPTGLEYHIAINWINLIFLSVPIFSGLNLMAHWFTLTQVTYPGYILISFQICCFYTGQVHRVICVFTTEPRQVHPQLHNFRISLM